MTVTILRRLLISTHRLLPSPSVIVNRCLSMSLQLEPIRNRLRALHHSPYLQFVLN